MTLRKNASACLLSISILTVASFLNAQNANAQSLDQPMDPTSEIYQTYLVNGLASVMPFVGYGFSNLKDKMAGNAKHYSYATPVEGRMAIQPMVLADIKKQYAANPRVKINLVGISYGGNIITSLASQLYSAGIPVNYMAVLDGPILAPITPNVHRVDNFVCRTVGCMGQIVRLSKGNNSTIHTEFKYQTSHIGLGDYVKVHNRILGQLTEYPLLVAGAPIDTIHTGSVAQ